MTIYPESIDNIKVGDLVLFHCADRDGNTAMGIVIAALPVTNKCGDVRVKWFEHQGRPGATATHHEYHLLLLGREESEMRNLKVGDIVWWDNPEDDGFKSGKVEVLELRGPLDENEGFVSVRQLSDDVVIEVWDEELYRRAK